MWQRKVFLRQSFTRFLFPSAIFLILFGLLIPTASSFNFLAVTRDISSSNLAAAPQGTADVSTKSTGMVDVMFSGKVSVVTDPVKIIDNEDGTFKSSLLQFFSDNRNLLLTSGKKDDKGILVEENDAISSTKKSKLLGRLESEAKKFKIEEAVSGAKDVSFLKVRSPTKFVGLTVSSVNVMAAILTQTENNLPEFYFVLLDSSQEASVPSPLVGLYNKLTGTNDSNRELHVNESTGSSSVTKVCTRISSSRKSICFEADAQLNVSVSFPKIMMKILPVKVNKFEEQGSASIQKVLEKSVKPSLDAFSEAYRTTLVV